MPTKPLPSNLAKTLRGHGLKVVEVPGWKTRGRPDSTGDFAPGGVLCHHTATRQTSLVASVLRLLIDGRADLPGPLCQIGLGRDGTVYLIASGRGNHAGTAKGVGTMASGDGNRLYIGVEAFNDGVGEPWLPVQYDAYVLLCAVLCVEVTGNSANTVAGHKETSVTGKIDPTFSMPQFRIRVAAVIGNINHPLPLPTPKPTLTSRGKLIDQAIAALEAATGKEARMKKIQAALAAAKLIKPIKQ